MILSLQTLEFCPYFYAHWFSDIVLRNSVILALFLIALELLSYPPKLWDSSSISMSIRTILLSFQTLEL